MLRRRARLPSEDLTFGLEDDGDDEAASLSSGASNDDDDDNRMTISAPAVTQTVDINPITTATKTTAPSQPLPIPLKPNSADVEDEEQKASNRGKTNGDSCPWSFLHTAAAGSESLSAAVVAARQRVREGKAPVPEVVVVRRRRRRRDRGGRRPRPPRLQLGRGSSKRLSLIEEEEGGWEVVGRATAGVGSGGEGGG